MQQLPILKKWIEKQFTRKDFTGAGIGVIKASIGKDPDDNFYTILKLREDNVDDGTFTRYNTYFVGDNIRIANGDEKEYFMLFSNNTYEYVCHQKGEVTTRWTIDEIKEITTTEEKYFGFQKIEKIIGYDIILREPAEMAEECIDVMTWDFKIKL